VKPLPTSIKETHWPEEPWVSSTREKEEQVRLWRVTSRPLLQTKTLRATGFFKSASSCCQFECILGVGGVIYIPHTLVPLKSLDLNWQRVKKIALKLHAHSVHDAQKLVHTRHSLEHAPHLQSNQERSAGLSAHNPLDPHWPFFLFSWRGFSSQVAPFSFVDVRSFLQLTQFFSLSFLHKTQNEHVSWGQSYWHSLCIKAELFKMTRCV